MDLPVVLDRLRCEQNAVGISDITLAATATVNT